MENLCTACLCTGRKLSYLIDADSSEVYHQILSEISVYETSLPPQVCWECLALLRRFYTFKSQVKHSYFQLLQFTQELLRPDISTICRAPHIRSHLQHNIECTVADNFSEVKDEYFEVSLTDACDLTFEDDKSEAKCPLGSYAEDLPDVKNETCTETVEIDTHDEPKTFALDHTEVKEKRKKKVKEKKKIKVVRVKKGKVKLIKMAEDTEPPSDDESVGGFDDPDFDLEEEKMETVDKVTKSKVKIVKSEKKIKEVTLSEEEIEREREELRKKEKFVKSEVRCDSCIVAFGCWEELESHNKEIHNLRHSHTCLRCLARVPTAAALHAHMRTHTTRYLCECGHRSRCALTHAAHRRTHAAERPVCGECGKQFSSKKTYRYHMNVLHKGQNRFPCPQCGKVYQWKSNLWRHIKNHKARDSGELYCAPCDRKFASVATYRQHVRVSLRHVTENEFTYVCSDCGRKFSNKTKLRDHVDWEHLNKVNYRCPNCDKPFKSGTSLYVHLQNVHRNKQDKDNLCHVCGKSYQSSAKLRYHIVAMHSGETPYACGHCGAAFSWYSSLYRHVREVHDKTKVSKKGKRGRKTEDVLPSLPHPPGPA